MGLEQAQREVTKMTKGKNARFTTAGERNWDYFMWRGEKKQRRGDLIVAFARAMLRVWRHWYFSTASR